MPDVTELLTLAGRDGGGDLDLAAVQARATTLHRREQALRVAAVAAAVAVVVPLLQVRGGTDALEQQPAGPTRPIPSGAATPPVPTASPEGRAAAAPAPSRAAPSLQVGHRSTPSAVPATAAVRPSTVAVAPTGAPAPVGGFPARQSCQVSATALGPGQESTCRFTATDRGGWYFENGLGTSTDYEDFEAAAEVLVQRADRVTRFDAMYGTCMDDVVLPGDRVTVTVRQAASGGYVDFDVGAGKGFDCSTTRVRP